MLSLFLHIIFLAFHLLGFLAFLVSSSRIWLKKFYGFLWFLHLYESKKKKKRKKKKKKINGRNSGSALSATNFTTMNKQTRFLILINAVSTTPLNCFHSIFLPSFWHLFAVSVPLQIRYSIIFYFCNNKISSSFFVCVCASFHSYVRNFSICAYVCLYPCVRMRNVYCCIDSKQHNYRQRPKQQQQKRVYTFAKNKNTIPCE